MKTRKPESAHSHRAGVFQRLARFSARATGHPVAFGVAVAVILVWAFSGPIFHFSDTWQLIINTATTIMTFLIVFLIQNAQNRDSEAIQLKLDELVRATKMAHNAVLDIEELSDQGLEKLRSQYERLAERARRELQSGKSDLGVSNVRVNSLSDK